MIIKCEPGDIAAKKEGFSHYSPGKTGFGENFAEWHRMARGKRAPLPPFGATPSIRPDLRGHCSHKNSRQRRQHPPWAGRSPD